MHYSAFGNVSFGRDLFCQITKKGSRFSSTAQERRKLTGWRSHAQLWPSGLYACFFFFPDCLLVSHQGFCLKKLSVMMCRLRVDCWRPNCRIAPVPTHRVLASFAKDVCSWSLSLPKRFKDVMFPAPRHPYLRGQLLLLCEKQPWLSPISRSWNMTGSTNGTSSFSSFGVGLGSIGMFFCWIDLFVIKGEHSRRFCRIKELHCRWCLPFSIKLVNCFDTLSAFFFLGLSFLVLFLNSSSLFKKGIKVTIFSFHQSPPRALRALRVYLAFGLVAWLLKQQGWHYSENFHLDITYH